ncbi:adenylate/guanylate cyclase domain-containing protein [Marinilabilia sp.]|uniref:adenylate/guanylate cyclase domain-containing protein n=1 Tax=Marinilabilia sp. TaxID=2021252 RepID=UPI0025C087A9|nr:adenylate/guanylate cyclase domain-containing protein [Marinilabilia sp.]
MISFFTIYTWVGLAVFCFLILAVAFWIRKYIQKRVEILTAERVALAMKVKEKAHRIHVQYDSDSIVYTHQGPKKKSRKYQKVTVLFADIQGFTRIVEQLNPEILIDELDQFFLHFDELVEKYGIEKIKTIGDAYMCAGGLPVKNSTNPIEVVLAGIEMQNYMRDMREIKMLEHKEYWELRIGIHTGPVISGMVGRKKISFDIWGDTVNIASRMESSGIAGEINVSGTTWQLVKEFFVSEYRGKMPVKYKGETDMFFIKGILPELSLNGEGKQPNELFRIRLQHIRFADMEEAVLNRLENELPGELTYHNMKHTVDVVTQAEIIGRGEEIGEEEMLLLKTAALFHDTGFLVELENHEDYSIEMAREVMQLYGFLDEQVEEVCQLINVTRKEAEPRNHLEAILKDADLDYLGRSDFLPVSNSLYHEFQHLNGDMSPGVWNKKQIGFIAEHKYYTKTAKKLRQVKKEKQLKGLREIDNEKV